MAAKVIILYSIYCTNKTGQSNYVHFSALAKHVVVHPSSQHKTRKRSIHNAENEICLRFHKSVCESIRINYPIDSNLVFLVFCAVPK